MLCVSKGLTSQFAITKPVNKVSLINSDPPMLPSDFIELQVSVAREQKSNLIVGNLDRAVESPCLLLGVG